MLPLAVPPDCPQLMVSPDGTLVAYDRRQRRSPGTRTSHVSYQSPPSLPAAPVAIGPHDVAYFRAGAPEPRRHRPVRRGDHARGRMGARTSARHGPA